MKEDLISIVKSVIMLHYKTGALFDKYGHDPQPDSLAFLEFTTFKDPEQVKTLYSQANLLIQGAADHITAFTKTLTEPLETIAPWTLVRGILETCALTAWLLDPNIVTYERVSRSLALRYEGLIQQAKLARVNEEFDLYPIEKRIEEVERKALKLGYPPVQDHKGKRIGIGQIMPSITELVKVTLNMESEYRIFSAMVHGHSWAYHQLGFKKDISTKDSVFLTKNISPIAICTLLETSLTSFWLAIKYKFDLFGWSINPIESYYKSAQLNTLNFFDKYVGSTT